MHWPIPVLAIVQEGTRVPSALESLAVFRFSPWNSAQVEAEVMEFLRKQRLSKENLQSMAALISAGLGVFLLAALAEKLLLFFDRIYVPRNVQAEFNRKHRSRYRLNKLFRAGVLQKCTCKDETNFRILRIEIDAGEAEALVQAQEKGTEYVLVDERRARDIGIRQGLTLCGTMRLLARLCQDGHADDTWVLVRRLRRELKFRIKDEVVAKAIESAEVAI